ncbi:hypothetical protein [Acinetobacter indicus]|uniref:hypothetical protein n=1 Tax=Acinetobacter indicus TaxID=756892 RepID=UPI00209A71B3|nr:hypothetical protein [Acinetobacter indicus]MCO8100941.1 hypothetical protein [Acinetobacter indicus]MCO8106526.1 hypothetical protein [Acinetobacter indicus]MCO8112219.1 hypothetical protein [Acinetobacter indicus]
MSSAAEIKRQHEQTALQKSKDKVVEALRNDPMGLSVNQLMGVCRLSIKTVKNILSAIDVREEDGVYFLADASRPVIDLQPQPVPVAKTAETTESAVPTKAVKDIQVDLLAILQDHPDGLFFSSIKEHLQITDKQFSKALYNLRRYHQIERTGSLGNFHYQLIQAEEQMETQETPVATERNSTEPFFLPLNELKDQIETVVTRKSQLTIHEEQLGSLLADLFNLNTVKFCVEGGRFVGVHLSEEVVA